MMCGSFSKRAINKRAFAAKPNAFLLAFFEPVTGLSVARQNYFYHCFTIHHTKMRFLILILCCTLGAAEDAGIKVRLTENALKYANKIGQEMLNAQIKQIKFPRIHIDVDGGPGHGKIEISKIRFANFTSPEYSFQFVPPTGVRWMTKNGFLNVTGNFVVWYNIALKVALEGSFAITADNFQLSATTDIVKGANGQPEISLSSCKLDLNVKVKLRGGPIPGMINMFRGPISDAVEKAIEEKVCDKAHSALIQRVNDKVAMLPMKFPVPVMEHSFILDHSMTSDPQATDRYIDVAINGSLTYMGEPTSVEIPKIPQSTEFEKMVYIFISDYVVNSMLTSAYNNNLLKFELSKEKTPQYAQFLRTTCPGSTCVSTHREQIGKLFPNNSVIVDLWTTKAPKVAFIPRGVEIVAQIQTKVHAEPKRDRTLLLHAQADVTVNLVPYVSYGKLFANATVENLELRVITSNVEEIGEFELWVIADVLNPKLADAINARLKKGLPLSQSGIVEVFDTKVKMLKRAIQIETDVKYGDYDIY